MSNQPDYHDAALPKTIAAPTIIIEDGDARQVRRILQGAALPGLAVSRASAGLADPPAARTGPPPTALESPSDQYRS